jgi:FkbM family methyltransferase
MPQPDPFSLGIADIAPRHSLPPAGAAYDLVRKAELEASLAAAPEDRILRSAYFEHLTRLAATCSGLFWAALPELAAPLHFRGGTPDITALAAAFRDDTYAVPGLRATPQRIVVIGAYAGYDAVALARAHPRARLLCAEPLADNFRLLSLNTTAWKHIRVAQTAIWHSTTRLAPAGRFQADWAVRLTDEALDADRVIGAMSLPELLGRAGWTHADMVVCDAAGSEREIFSDPLAPWLRHVDVALVRIYEQLAPQAGAVVAACFPEATFQHRRHGTFDLYERRTPLTALPPQAEELSLLRAAPGGASFALQDVANYGWAFFIFDGTSCQLHPNPPGEKPARALFPLHLDGQTRFTSGVVHAGQPASPSVTFTARLQREDGTVLAEASTTVAGHNSDRLGFAVPEGPRGPALMVLETAMAPGAVHNQMAWARWIDPRLS